MIALRIFPKILLTTIVLILSCSSSPEIFQGDEREWTTNGITQKRDMDQYEKGGHFWCHTRPFGNEGDRLAGEKKVRDFVWQHWTEKKRGYIKISCGHIDTSGTIHYFVEPNEKGEWSVAIRSLYKHDLPKYNKQPIKDITAVSVERIENKADGNSNWTLIFKAIDGEIVEKFPFFNF